MELYGTTLRFTRQQRLLNAGDFRRVFDGTTTRAACPELLFLAIPNQQNLSRLGFIIAKKHVKLAVQRNLIKRVIREHFRQHPQTQPGKDIVVLARKGAAQLDKRALNAIARKMLLKIDQRMGESQPQAKKNKKSVKSPIKAG